MTISDSAPQLRLAVLIAQSGLCSRRAASRLITAGRVTVGAEIASHTTHLSDSKTIRIDGQPLPERPALRYYLYHKPVGVDCNIRADDPASIAKVLSTLPERLYPVGRLDKDSRGLLLLTNDGALTQRLLHPDSHQAKTYLVRIDKVVTANIAELFGAGISWQVGPHHYKANPCQVEIIEPTRLKIMLEEGQNRQIRYMCRALGYRVLDLYRVAIGELQLGALPEGTLRPVSAEELRLLSPARAG